MQILHKPLSNCKLHFRWDLFGSICKICRENSIEFQWAAVLCVEKSRECMVANWVHRVSLYVVLSYGRNGQIDSKQFAANDRFRFVLSLETNHTECAQHWLVLKIEWCDLNFLRHWKYYKFTLLVHQTVWQFQLKIPHTNDRINVFAEHQQYWYRIAEIIHIVNICTQHWWLYTIGYLCK